jgi:four helix bundle protein
MEHNFRELKIWKAAMDVIKSTYILCAAMPADEKFGLISQMQRCSVSIPSNIAEGSGRNSEKDFLRFLNMAISSAFELETQLILAKELFQSNTDKEIEHLHTLQKMIWGFKRRLTFQSNAFRLFV